MTFDDGHVSTCERTMHHFAYKALQNKDTLHIKHYKIWTLCIYSIYLVFYMQIPCDSVLCTALYAAAQRLPKYTTDPHSIRNAFVTGVKVHTQAWLACPYPSPCPSLFSHTVSCGHTCRYQTSKLKAEWEGGRPSALHNLHMKQHMEH